MRMTVNETSIDPVGVANIGKIDTFKALAQDIKISHSVFALPFAILATIMSRPVDGSWLRFAGQFLLIIVCMVTARTVAMLANRLFDRTIDAKNPRTVTRALPSKRVAVRDALTALIISAGVFEICCIVFGFIFDNWWPFILSVPVLVWISVYPLLKRFTWLCHMYLGSSLAISPIAAAIAIDPIVVIQQASLWLLSLYVLCWVAGFDIIYALQDIKIDREQGLSSIPSKLGVNNALWISRLLHSIGLASLVYLIWSDRRFGILFVIGLIIVSILLVFEHIASATVTTKRIQLAFFTLNGIISCLLGTLGVLDILYVQ